MKSDKSAKAESWKIGLALAIILLISFLVYLPVLNNGLLAWDDDRYIKDNPLIHSINLKAIFSEYVVGNYHPITILGFAIEYKFFGLNAAGYHTVNLFLHLFNVALVFYAVFLLSEKYGVALIAALLFGVHPLHVESVAWAAELKDLLYTFFFLASWIFYMKYLKDFQKKYILIALLLFLLSLLSKAMAAPLPLVLILTDYLKGRKIDLKSLLEKLPFFVLAIILGVVAIKAQKYEGATDMIVFPLMQQIIFSCYGFITYLVKLIVPLDLSAYYPYPVKIGDMIPAQYYAYLLLFFGLVGGVFYSLRYSRKFFFGIAFFSVTVFLVLQLFPVGGAMMADRYSYIPSIGIFILAGEGLDRLWNRKLKSVASLLLIAFTVFFSLKTYSRSSIWNNDLTLWNDVIGQYQTVATAYHNRGLALIRDNRKEEALNDLNKALELKPDHVNAHKSRGILFMQSGRNADAINDFTKALELKPGDAITYANRGSALVSVNKLDEALSDFNEAIKLKPDYIEAYYGRGLLYTNLGKQEQAISDYSKAIELNPNYIEAYVNRGNILRSQNKIDEALNDYKKAIELNPGFPITYFNRGAIFLDQKKYDIAISDFSKAIELNPNYSKAFYLRALAEYNLGKKDIACPDLKKASQLGYQVPADMFNLICK